MAETNDARFAGKVAIVTGGALGIGGGTARRLAADGASVLIADIADDAAQAVTRIVRGRDLAPSTAIHVVLQRLLGFETPTYRHHLLLLEERGGKLAKLHGAVGWNELSRHYEPPMLCGILASAAGLIAAPQGITPRELLPSFTWERVRALDQTLRWSGTELTIIGR